MNYETQIRTAAGKDYLKIDLKDNSQKELESVKTAIEALEEVKRVNITTKRNRDNLTVYPDKFFTIDICEEAVQERLDTYFED